MSLINQVLQDLDKRGADPIEDAQLSGEIRPVAALGKRGRSRSFVWALLVIGAVVVAIAAWSRGEQLKHAVTELWIGGRASLPSVASSPAPVTQPQSPQAVQQQVATALMVPVFQLSDELATLPAAAGAASVAANERPAEPSSATPAAAGTQQQSSAPTSTTPKAGQPATQATPKRQPSATPAKATTASRPTVTKVPASKPAVQSQRREEPLEQVMIPAQVPSQIEKQARQLTPYERAELAFRDGVASLRLGRASEAERYFRESITEDRSHAAAQQALVGMLINAGRLDDAEQVLNDSLSANPRQPKQAMLLARLQVERGDLEVAIETLERVSPYAGNDANYLSFMAAVLQRAQRHEQAVAQYRNALALMPRNAVWLMGLGISLRAMGESEQAQQAFASAAAIGTLNTDLQAFVERQQRELQRAVN